MLILCVLSYILQMAFRKRKAPSTPTQVRFDRSRFTSQEAWERYTNIIVPRKLLPERNVVVYLSQRALLRASEGEAHGCAFQRRKDARSCHQRLFVENVGTTEGNRSK